MPLQPVARRSVADEVFDQLLDGMLAGELAPGAPLPAERALTETLGVNRQAVREALQRLAAAGLVEIRHGDKTRVRDYRRGAGLDLLARLLVRGDGSVDPEVVRSVMELRACLGPEIARRCAQRATPQVAEAVAAAAGRMADTDDLVALAALDLQFWDVLVEGSENIAYRLAFNGLRQTYEPVAGVLGATLAEELADRDSRAAIAAAISAGDGEAAAGAAQRLLERGQSAVLHLLETIAGEEQP